MPKTDFIEQLRQRLLELGCPRKQVRRLVQEVADHREDLKQAALQEGTSAADAEAGVDAKFGDPLYLAEHQMMMLRRSSWWGRHSLAGFCLLPLLAVPLLWALLLGVNMALEFALGYGWDKQKLHVAVNNPVVFHRLVIAVHCADYAAVALVTLLFCWLARRSSVRLLWMMIACAICSLYSLFIWIQVKPHSFSLGVTWHPHWMRAAIPFLIVGAIVALQRRTTQSFREEEAA
jgi:hypothetical protein